ncbi:dihydrolipoamide acetyltransferase family protein [Nocardioides sp.]|uniref:dihydrolipoamide acetyltransferase family protein n=1 Tax=Nocardioides sp. TaxID=35761 RepID=UPI0026175553|nr:dihydrolipoamide acetyltransferase family protein [Nocardioides sp.]
MPEVAANATEAVLAEWLVGENAEFAALDTIATVETEKALVDVEAEDAGVVLKTLVPPGALVEVGAPIAVLGVPGEAAGDLDAVLAELGVAEPVEHVVPERRSVPDPVVEVRGAPAPSLETTPQNGRIFASPLARKLARLAEIPVEQIAGTGPRGRILRRDVEAAVAARPVVEPVETPAPTQGGRPVVEPVETPHSRLRRAIASRLVESKQTAPHFYLRATVRADRLVALRAELNEGAETRVSLNDLVVKAVAAAHARVPEMNVVWTPDAVRSFSSVDVAVAVATDRGLVTPVLRDVTSLTVSAVAAKVQDLATRAREGRLKQDELEGGTISVTNLGMYGVEEFAAIINPPHAAILAVGAVRDEPVVEDGAVVPGQVMTVTLSVDHRPVDGVVAARWLAALVDLLEHPTRILA